MPAPALAETAKTVEAQLPDDIAEILKVLLGLKARNWHGKITLHIEAGATTRWYEDQVHQMPSRHVRETVRG